MRDKPEQAASKDPATKFLARLRRRKPIAIAVVIGIVVIAIGNFVDGLKKITEFTEKLSDPTPTSIPDLQRIVLSTSGQAAREFDSKTHGKAVPVARSEFADTQKLLRRISRLDPGNGHAIYYSGLIIRWTGDRPGSHTVLYSYLEGIRRSGALQAEDDGSVQYCSDYWRGFCKQRAAWLNHLLALDFTRDAKEEKQPEIALQWRRKAMEHAEAATRLYGGFSDPKQGTPTVVLLEQLRKEIAASQGTMAVSAPPAAQ
jgi:hypothetical protein